MDKLNRSEPCDKDETQKEEALKFKGLELSKNDQLEALEAQKKRQEVSQEKIEMLEIKINDLLIQQEFGLSVSAHMNRSEPCDKDETQKEEALKFKGLELSKNDQLEALEAQKKRQEASQKKIEMLEIKINDLLMQQEQEFGLSVSAHMNRSEPCDKDETQKEEALKFKGLELSKNDQLEALEAQKKRQEVSQEKIEMLEIKINDLLKQQEQEFGLSVSAYRNYLAITKTLNEAEADLSLKKTKITKVHQLKSKMESLLQELNLKQEKNRRCDEELTKQKAKLNDWIENADAQLDKAKTQIAEVTQVVDKLSDRNRDLQVEIYLDQKIRETTESIAKKRADLALKKYHETELKQLNHKKEALEVLDKQMKSLKADKEVQELMESEMAAEALNVQDTRISLLAQLYRERDYFVRDIESLKKENEDVEYTMMLEETKLKMRERTVKKLERTIKKLDVSNKKYAKKLEKKKKIINKNQLATKPAMSAFDKLLLAAESLPINENKVTIIEDDAKDGNATSVKPSLSLLDTQPNKSAFEDLLNSYSRNGTSTKVPNPFAKEGVDPSKKRKLDFLD